MLTLNSFCVLTPTEYLIIFGGLVVICLVITFILFKYSRVEDPECYKVDLYKKLTAPVKDDEPETGSFI